MSIQEESVGRVIADLLIRSKQDASNSIRPPTVGTLSGSNVSIDSLGISIPVSDMVTLKHWQDSKETHDVPKYSSGAKLLLLPLDDGNTYAIVGEVQ